MELVQVKIKTTVVTSRYGSLSEGDILRTDAEFARHLVEDCGAAELVGVLVESKPTVIDMVKENSTRKRKYAC